MGDCESWNAGMQNRMQNVSTMVKFSVTWSTIIYRIALNLHSFMYVSCRSYQ